MSLRERVAALISGSDLRGVALAGYGNPVTLTPELAASCAAGFAAWACTRAGNAGRPLRVAVGHDSRLSADALSRAVIAGLTASGASPVDVGLATTPAMFMCCVLEPVLADCAVMITASHLPPERNGLKFITREGGLDKSELLEIAVNAVEVDLAETAFVEQADFMQRYTSFLTELVRSRSGAEKPLEGKRITLDAGNGAGGFFVDVLSALGADVAGRCLEPDGRFPNHAPNPEDAGAMRALSEAVLETKADLGILFDADADRVGFCGPDGQMIARNRLIALCASALMREHVGATIVTDSVTSRGLTDFIIARGGIHRRTKRGYRVVIDAAKRLCAQGVNCPLAIETSGHAALRENRFLDDGAYLACWLLIEFGRNADGFLSALDGLKEPVEEAEIRLALDEPDFRAQGERAIAAVTRVIEARDGFALDTENMEGVRADVRVNGVENAAWFIVRLSVHDPVLPINIESDVKGGVDLVNRALADALAGIVKTNGLSSR